MKNTELMYFTMKRAEKMANKEYAPGTAENYAYRQGALDGINKVVSQLEDVFTLEQIKDALESDDEYC